MGESVGRHPLSPEAWSPPNPNQTEQMRSIGPSVGAPGTRPNEVRRVYGDVFVLTPGVEPSSGWSWLSVPSSE